MKLKKIISFFSIAVLLFSVLFVTACKKEETLTFENLKDSDIKSVEISGLNSTYQVGSSIDFSNVKVTVKYGSETLVIESSDITFDQTDTTKKVYIDTDGLNGETNLEAGSHQILCKLIGTKSSKLFQVKVINIKSDTNNFVGCTAQSYSQPKFIQTYKSNINKNESEDTFKSTDEVYTVGQANYFKYLPELKVKLAGETDFQVMTSGFSSLIQLYLIDGSSETLVGSDYYSFDNEQGIKFNEIAIGKTFKIKATLQEEIVDESENAFLPVSLIVKVEEGFNAYSALDLGILNLSKLSRTYNNDAPWSLTNRNISSHSGDYSVWYNEDTKSYQEINYVELWEGFLEGKGYTISDEMYDVKGIYIHGDITISKNDIPSEYLISSEEAGSKTNAIGSLRDEAIIYNHPMASDFVFNGNYFTISLVTADENDMIKIGQSNSNSGFKIYSESDNVEFGHSKLFFFGGDKTGENAIKVTGTLTGNLSDGNILCPYKVTFKNVNSIGNCDLDEEDADKYKFNACGLIFVEPSYCQATISNCIVKKYMMAFDLDNFAGKEENGQTTYILNCKAYDCFNAAVFLYECYSVEVRNCELKRFGGPAFFSVGGSICGSNLKMYDNTVENYVDGTEAWFSINSGTMIADYIKALQTDSNGVSGFGTRKVVATSGDHEGKMNLIYLTLSGSYLSSSAPHYYVSHVELNEDGENKVNIRLEQTDEDSMPQERIVHEAFKQSAANAYAFAFVTEDCIGEIVPADGLGEGSPNICIDLNAIRGMETDIAKNLITNRLANVQANGLNSPYVYDGENELTGDYIAILATPESLSNTTIGLILEFAD